MSKEKKTASFYALSVISATSHLDGVSHWFRHSVEELFEDLIPLRTSPEWNLEKWSSLRENDVSLVRIEMGKNAVILATIDGECAIHIPEDKVVYTINSFPYQKYPDLGDAPNDVFVCKNCQTFQSADTPCLVCKVVKH